MKTAILYNKNSNVKDFATKIYEKIRPRSEDFELIGLEVKKFNNGELYVYCPENIRKKECFFIHDSSENPCEWLSELLLVNDMLKRASAEEIVNVLPFLLYSRQDRKDKPRVPISAKVIADLISLNASRIITTDLHATQIQGFYNIPFDALYTFSIAVKYLKEKYPDILENLVIVSPDVGGANRARAFAKKLNCEIALIDKRREKAGEIAEMSVIGEVSGKNAIIVDDMIDTGGTIIEAAKKLREKGARKVFAYATHAVFSNKAEEKLPDFFDKIIVSDSIPRNYENEKIEVISLVDLYAEAIYRAKMGTSISELFQ